ncbi:MAG: hypothetical protein K2X66_15710 [Cyanobacteria bacterium]|nr:hypothetical protein [Cyanobacteriota bacterium]
MLIHVSPHKVTTTTLEIWLEHSLTMGASSLGGALTLGHVFRFEGASPVYGQLLSLEDGHREGFWLAKLSVLLGVPALPMTTATVLSDEALSQDIHYLRGGQATSLKMGQHFTSDLSELGTITLIECPSYALQKKAFSVVLEELQPYQKHLIIDPVGHFFEDDKGFKQVIAGKDCKLSLQTVRVEKFLKLIASSLPTSLEEEGLRLLSKLIPATPDFIPFKQFLRPEKIPDMAVKSPLVHLLFEVFQEGIFANDPGEVFQPEALLNNQTSVVNLSRLKAPWKNFFYEAICQEMLVAQERMEKPHFVLTLLYPENYLSDVGQCVRKAHELGLNLILMPASYEVENLREVSNNLLSVDASGLATLKGSSTMHLPIQFHLNGTLRDAMEEGTGAETSSYTEIQGADEEFHYKQFELPETPWQSSFRADLEQLTWAKPSSILLGKRTASGMTIFRTKMKTTP